MNHIEATTKIYWTSEYGMFKFLKGNRDLNPAKVEKIKRAIIGGVDILRYAPVIVNQNMEIIDGQHRFAVSRELKSNVYYVIHMEADLEIVPAINSNSSNWKTADYLNSYMDLKKDEYLKLNDFAINKFPQLNLATAIKLLYKGNPSDAKQFFRDGNYTCSNYDKAIKICEFLTDFVPHCENPFSSRWIEVAEQLLKSELYNHEMMLEKFNHSGRKVVQLHSVKHIIEDLESIINHGLKKRIHIV